MKRILTLIVLAKISYATSVIGILDNQVDYTHHQVSHSLWQSATEINNGIDDDSNGFIDDVNGWNFIDNSAELFDYTRYGKFPEDIYTYYEMRARKSLGTITTSELAWYNQIRKEDDFKKIKKEFTSYVHGTHITCLALGKGAAPKELTGGDIKFLPIRYLGKATSGAFVKPSFKPLKLGTNAAKIIHINKFIKAYTVWMTGKLDISIGYLKGKVQVVNGSWGMGYGSSQKLVLELFKKQFEDSEQYQEEIEEIALVFMKKLLKKTKGILRTYPEILFVFSAGNKKENTDIELHYPSSIVLSNVISVAASDPQKGKASFSNYGARTVGIFAPGVAIKSCAPENRIIPINGTSQAAPQVSSVAIKIIELVKQMGLKIKPGQVKNLIYQTADKNDKLADLSVSGGILNPARSFQAARNLKTMQWAKAMASAKLTILD